LQFNLDPHPFRFHEVSGQLDHIAGVGIAFFCLLVEGELFGQPSLCEIHGPRVGKELEKNLRRLEEHMLLLERCHRMMARSFAHLEARRGRAAKTAVTVAQAGQVNVDCAVMNKVGR